MTKHFRVALLLGSFTVPAVALAQTEGPYAGEVHREIKSLSAKEVDDLVQGRGMSLAKAAELNRYPGPTHALELARELKLSAEQRNGLEASRSRMSARAKALRAEILRLERDLEAAFFQRRIASARLNDLTARSAQGRVRCGGPSAGAHQDGSAALAGADQHI